jgi:hypothetical protein
MSSILSAEVARESDDRSKKTKIPARHLRKHPIIIIIIVHVKAICGAMIVEASEKEKRDHTPSNHLQC